MAKFNLSLRKNEDGSLDLSELSLDLADDSKIQVTRDTDGSVHASWEGDIGTVKSVISYLKSQFPGMPDWDIPGLP